MPSNALKNNQRRVDLVEVFRILELLAQHSPVKLETLCDHNGLSPATAKRRLADIRRLGVDVTYDRVQGGYRIRSWGRLIQAEAVKSGLWRRSMFSTSGDGASSEPCSGEMRLNLAAI